MKDFTYNIDTNIENDTHMRMIANVTIRNPLREEIKFDTKCFFDTGSVHSYISTDAKDKLELTIVILLNFEKDTLFVLEPSK